MIDLPTLGTMAGGLGLFHTAVNLIGVLLMWPLAQRLTRWLQQRFRAREEDEAQPHSSTTPCSKLAVPTLALDALSREVARAGQVTLRMTRSVLAGADAVALKADHSILVSLDGAIERFVERLRSASMSQVASARLAELLRIERYHEAGAEQAVAAAALPSLGPVDPRLAAAATAFTEAADALLRRCDPTEPTEMAGVDAGLGTMEARYEELKAQLLAAEARLELTDMEQALRR